MKNAKKALEGLGDPSKNAKLKKALAKVNEINTKILKEHLGFE